MRIQNSELRIKNSGMFQHSGGFTLVELLVVIAIIGILTGLVTVNINAARAKARDNRRVADIANLATSLELYRSVKKQYPVPNNNPDFQDVETLTSFIVPSYMSVIPSDPSKSRPPNYAFGRGYVYMTNQTTVDGQTRNLGSLFFVDATLEQKTVDAPLDSLLTAAATNNSVQNAFRTGYFLYPATNGQIHYRISR